MTETLSPPRPKKKIKWFLVLACLLLLAGCGWLYFFLTATGDGTPYRLVMPGGAASGAFGPRLLEVAPELAQDGLAVEYLSTSGDVKQIAFFRKERQSLKIRVTAGKKGVDKLSYTILGANDEKLGQGKVTLGPLKPGESGEGEIVNVEIPNGRRTVISE